MSSRRWYVVAAGTAVTAVSLLLLAANATDAVLDSPVGMPFAFFTLFSWLFVPLGVYLDLRTLDDVPWNPSIGRWLLVSIIPLANAAAGFTYCVRRHAAVRRTVPSGRWYYGVVVGIALWIGLFVGEVVASLRPMPAVVNEAAISLLLVVVFAFPPMLYLDLAHVRGYTDDTIPVGRVVLLGSIPYVSAIVGGAYLYRRHTAFRDADDPTMLYLADGTSAGDARRTSPWFPRAATLFGVHFLLLVVLAFAVPELEETTLQVTAILLWLPFGPFFAVCVWKDAQWRRVNGVDVGDNWGLYLVSAVVQAAAFWYLVRRASKFAGRESDARANVGDRDDTTSSAKRDPTDG